MAHSANSALDGKQYVLEPSTVDSNESNFVSAMHVPLKEYEKIKEQKADYCPLHRNDAPRPPC